MARLLAALRWNKSAQIVTNPLVRHFLPHFHSLLPPPFLLSSSMPCIFLFGSCVFLFHASLMVVQRRVQENGEIKQIRIANLNLPPPLGFIGHVGSPLGSCGGDMPHF